MLQTIASSIHAVKSELPSLASKKADPSQGFAETDARDEKKTTSRPGLRQKAQASVEANTETQSETQLKTQTKAK